MNRAEPRIGLTLKVAQKQILTPGLVQMVSVLALNQLELRDMINQELVANPVLEEMSLEVPTVGGAQGAVEPAPMTSPNGDAPADAKADSFQEVDYGSFFRDYLDPGFRSPAAEDIERPSYENFLSKPSSLSDHLQWQVNLSVAPDKVRDAAYSIIGNLNEDGYLTTGLEEVAESGGHELKDVEEALKLVQMLDPPGIGARDLRECLLLQVRMTDMENPLVEQVISGYLNKLESRQYREIAGALGCTVADVETVLELIRKLDPRPGQRYNNTEPRLIVPDLAFVKTSDGYRVDMNDDGMPQLRLNREYRRLLSDGGQERDVRNYVKERFASAIQLIKNIEQRRQTILRVCDVIIRRQREFLDRGMDYLRPMMIKEVAEEIGVHPSTVSRAVANKYAHTPQGVHELRFFFSEAVQGPSGGSVSLINLKRTVSKMIEDEDAAHPLTDDQITRRLRDTGIFVTRRTVAKYREDMRIPSTHQRRRKS